MKIIPFVLLLIIFIFVGCAGTQYEANVQALDISQSDSRTSSAKVFAKTNEWSNSGVIVKKGYAYEINAEGKWLSGINCKWTGPDGIGSKCLLGELGDFLGGPIISGWGPVLIGKVGKEGVPFPVGSKYDLTPETDGILFFRINDCKGCTWDNKGSLTVETSFIAKQNYEENVFAVEAEPTQDILDLEKGLPVSSVINKSAIAVVIGNRDYTRVKNVDYAVHDAQVVRKYLIHTLGFKKGNVFLLLNASKSDFELYFGNEKNYKGKLFNAVKEGESDVFVYYSGHGAPGLKEKKGFFVPVEADPQYLELSGYSAEVFYSNLSKVPAKSTTVVLDACFSGATVYENISPMVLEIDNPVIDLKDGVVLSSSSGSEVSSWYNDKKHGMFTYFFLKAIYNMNADINNDGALTFKEIYNYISDKSEGVPYYARRLHGVEQNPTIQGDYEDKVLVRYK